MSVGTTIHPITDLEFIKGQEISVADPSGPVVVVEFWATWCPPCRNSIPRLTELQHKFKDKGLIIVGITNEKDKIDQVKSFVNDMGDKMDYTVAIDRNEAARKAIFLPSGAKGIPRAFILIKNKIVWSGHPMEGSFEEEISKALQQSEMVHSVNRSILTGEFTIPTMDK